MKFKHHSLTTLLILISTLGIAQGVGINPTGSAPDPSAGLDIDFTDRGLLVPRLTSAQRDLIVSPAPGLLIYNIDNSCINLWTGSTWKQSCFDCAFSPPMVSNNSPLCEGATLLLSSTPVSGASYHWTGPNGFSSNDQNPSIPNSTTSASGSYSLTVTLNGCTSSPINTAVTINPIPYTPTAGNAGPACLGNNVSLNASPIIGANYSWTGPNGFSSNVQNPLLSNVSFNEEGLYELTVIVNGCSSSAASTNLDVITTPETPETITGLSETCSGSNGITYSIEPIDDALTYNWTVPSGASIASGDGTSEISVNFGVTSGDVCVTAENSCGVSSPSCLSIVLPGAPGGSQTFDYTANVVTWTVPACITTGITIEAWGAQGGSNVAYNGRSGGRGAYIKGTFASVNEGTVLKLVVGGEGATGCSDSNCSNGSGGGGTFVWIDGQHNLPLIAAGGGGGSTDYDGGHGSATTSPTNNQGGAGNGAGGSGGEGGSGGSGGSYPSAGGGCGWLSSGGVGQVAPQGGGGQRPLAGGAGGFAGTYGAVGGFGGGGGSAGHRGSGGGGGGYNGGGGGNGFNGSNWGAGGGGGSYNGGTNQTNIGGSRTGNGQITISW